MSGRKEQVIHPPLQNKLLLKSWTLFLYNYYYNKSTARDLFLYSFTSLSLRRRRHSLYVSFCVRFMYSTLPHYIIMCIVSKRTTSNRTGRIRNITIFPFPLSISRARFQRETRENVNFPPYTRRANTKDEEIIDKSPSSLLRNRAHSHPQYSYVVELYKFRDGEFVRR